MRFIKRVLNFSYNLEYLMILKCYYFKGNVVFI